MDCPRNLEHHYAAIFKPHPCDTELFNVHNTAKSWILLGDVIFRDSGDPHRFRVPHRIQRVVHVVDTDVYDRTGTRCLFVDECTRRVPRRLPPLDSE